MLKLGRLGYLICNFGLVFASGVLGVLGVLRVLRGEEIENEEQTLFDPWMIKLISCFLFLPF